MKKAVILVLLISLNTYSQIEDAWVYFKNKPNASTYLSNPLSMLTQRALDRRSAQKISLDISDVPIHEAYIEQVASLNGIVVMAKSKWFNALHIRGAYTNILALNTFSFVDKIEFANKALNSKSSKTVAYHLNKVNKNLETQTYNYGNSANQIEMLNGHVLHQQNYKGQGKIIAVLDSGFQNVDVASSFQNLISNNQILGGYNFPDRNTNYFSRHNHGTNVLSCMGSIVENQLIGTAPLAQYYLFITEDIFEENPVEESYWVEAAEMADYYGADIINSSLGYFEYDNPSYSHTYSDMIGTKAFASRGANMAFEKGMIVVVSAGNSGSSNNPHIGVLAKATKALAIGAVDSNENYVSFSSQGPSFDNRVKPDVCAKGLFTTISSTTGAIVTSSGTSFSSPVIAGMVASLWSAVPSLSNIELTKYIVESADLFSNPTIFKGYGVPDFQRALSNAIFDLNNKLITTLIYPNPVQNSLTIESSIKNGNFLLFNNLGQLVKDERISNNLQNISLESLQSGIYFYEISAPNVLKRGKIVKQ